MSCTSISNGELVWCCSFHNLNPYYVRSRWFEFLLFRICMIWNPFIPYLDDLSTYLNVNSFIILTSLTNTPPPTPPSSCVKWKVLFLYISPLTLRMHARNRICIQNFSNATQTKKWYPCSVHARQVNKYKTRTKATTPKYINKAKIWFWSWWVTKKHTALIPIGIPPLPVCYLLFCFEMGISRSKRAQRHTHKKYTLKRAYKTKFRVVYLKY